MFPFSTMNASTMTNYNFLEEDIIFLVSSQLYTKTQTTSSPPHNYLPTNLLYLLTYTYGPNTFSLPNTFISLTHLSLSSITYDPTSLTLSTYIYDPKKFPILNTSLHYKNNSYLLTPTYQHIYPPFYTSFSSNNYLCTTQYC